MGKQHSIINWKNTSPLGGFNSIEIDCLNARILWVMSRYNVACMVFDLSFSHEHEYHSLRYYTCYFAIWLGIDVPLPTYVFCTCA